MKRFTAAYLKCILYEINNIYTIYTYQTSWNVLKSVNCTLPDRKNPVFHATCVNLSLVKDLNPCPKILCQSQIMESEI